MVNLKITRQRQRVRQNQWKCKHNLRIERFAPSANISSRKKTQNNKMEVHIFEITLDLCYTFSVDATRVYLVRGISSWVVSAKPQIVRIKYISMVLYILALKMPPNQIKVDLFVGFTFAFFLFFLFFWNKFPRKSERTNRRQSKSEKSLRNYPFCFHCFF